MTNDQGSSDKVQELTVKLGTWPNEPMRIGEQDLDDLLLWCSQNGASDISVQTDRPVYIEVDGILFPITRRPLDSADMANVLARVYGPDALAKLASGRDLDLSYEVRPDRNTRVRFRVNITAILSKGRDSVQVTL
ncbi:MAG: ATPase, partial [Alphaproteobacteria bacterium]|nr:ATPase [Alphaproteobacteria bacterium]